MFNYTIVCICDITNIVDLFGRNSNFKLMKKLIYLVITDITFENN